MSKVEASNSPAEASPVFVEVVVPWLFGLICVVGLVGNALVVVVVACNPQMRSTTNMLIINLAIADLLFIVFCVPFTAIDYSIGYWPFGDVWCRTVQYFINVCALASIYTLVLMSVDRYLAVVHPITSMQLRVEHNSLIACALLWVIIVIACIPVAFIHGTNPAGVNTREVFCTYDFDRYNHNVYQIVFSLTSFFAPLVVIFVLYMLMLNRLWLRARSSAESVRSRRRVTRLVVVVVLTFAVCWAPIQVILFLKSMQMIDVASDMTLLVLQVCAQILAYTNSCLNPILYAFLSENFRKAFRKLILCGAREAPLGQLGGHQHSVNTHTHNHHPRESTVVTTANRHKKGSGTTTLTARNGQLISDILLSQPCAVSEPLLQSPSQRESQLPQPSVEAMASDDGGIGCGSASTTTAITNMTTTTFVAGTDGSPIAAGVGAANVGVVQAFRARVAPKGEIITVICHRPQDELV
ncbi:allatostatin-A receptor-like isoform X1 [Varroa destructor]|uniref:G-protein coupled receptors family 1 profile domain-containing protein n=2 Tax=Varroa TaxID=62624 RepID=A0A7M7JAL1_VARDE|nr:allatostatin-A receptor-like isoform X1 [Varroa destructor]